MSAGQAITPDALLAEAELALRRYELGADVALELIGISENATFRVQTPDRNAVLRLHRAGYVTRQNIASELAWTDAMRRDGAVRTAQVLPAGDGEPIVTLRGAPLADERHAVLFELLPGTEPAEDSVPGWMEQIGEVAGRIHAFSAAWTAPRWFARHEWDYETTIGACARWGSWQHGPVSAEQTPLLARTARRIGERLEGHRLSRGLVHGDLRLANVLVDGSDLAVIDFDDCGWGWHLFDLATTFRTVEAEPFVADAVEAWLRGYRRHMPLPADAIDAAYTLMMLSRLQGVGWMATHPETDLVREFGGPYVEQTCGLAESYLTTGRW